jgi:hypothetical protein
MDAQPVQTAEQFATELHARWMQEMSDRKRGFYGEPDDYFYIRRAKLARRAGTFYLYSDQDGGSENATRLRESIIDKVD